MLEVDEVVQTIKHLARALEELAIRGLRICEPGHLNPLKFLRDEFEKINASHLSHRLDDLIQSVEHRRADSAELFLRTQSALRTFERVLTLEVAEQLLRSRKEASDRE